MSFLAKESKKQRFFGAARAGRAQRLFLVNNSTTGEVTPGSFSLFALVCIPIGGIFHIAFFHFLSPLRMLLSFLFSFFLNVHASLRQRLKTAPKVKQDGLSRGLEKDIWGSKKRAAQRKQLYFQSFSQSFGKELDFGIASAAPSS